MSITEADYPRLTELLTLTHTITLDCDHIPDPYDNEEEMILLNYCGNQDFYGNVESRYLSDLGGKAIAKRFRTFVQPDGEIGLEISFLPGQPFDNEDFEKHAKALWSVTRIEEAMSYDEYIRDLRNGANWVNDLLGEGGEVYAVLVEVTKPGRAPALDEAFEKFFEKPLWIQRQGEKYNVHIFYYQD